jgi:hypothetical protein
MANAPFIFILLVSLYFAGKKLVNKNTGLLAACIVMMYPYVFNLSHVPLLDFPLTAMFSLSFCLLTYSEDFTKRFPSVMFGISCGLGMLTQQIFPLFIFPPLLFALLSALSRRTIFTRTVFLNLLFAFSAATAVYASWAIPHFDEIAKGYQRQLFVIAQANAVPAAGLTSSDVLLYNLDNLINKQILPFYFLVFFVSAAAWLCVQGQEKTKALLFFSIVGVYALFLFLKHWHARTITPYLIFFALVSAAGMLSVRSRRLRLSIVLSVLLFGICQYLALGFGCDRLFASLRPVPLLRILVPHNPDPTFGLSFASQTVDFQHDAIASFLLKDGGTENNATIAMISWIKRPWDGNMSYVAANRHGFEYYAAIHRLPLTVADYDYNNLSLFDFIVLPDAIDTFPPWNACSMFPLGRVITLADNSKLYVYRKNAACREEVRHSQLQQVPDALPSIVNPPVH